MSWWISLVDAKTDDVLIVDDPIDLKGGTYAVGDNYELTLNVTYNYSEHFYRVLGKHGIRSFDGFIASDTIPSLERAITKLGDDVDDDYWKPTEGNAKEALKTLLKMAQIRPDGVWQVD